MSNYKKHHGFSLLELLITIAILGILIGIASPLYRAMIERQKVRAVLNEWRSSFQFAQSEALRLKDGVILCAAASDGKKCSGTNDFSNGWLVVREMVGLDPEVLQDSPLIDKRISVIFSSSPDGAEGKLKFFGNGRLDINAGGSLSVKLKDYELKLIISSGGRLREGA